MPELSALQARGMYTEMLIDVFREEIEPKLFLCSFFKEVTSRTKYISIEVRRGTERIAVDVMRGSEGNRNKMSLSTLKKFAPPYFHEYFDATQLDIYDRLFGTGTLDDQVFANFLKEVAEKLAELRNIILRAYELQCSQVLQTGIVTLKHGININFKRKAASLVDLNTTTGYWSVTNHDPYADFATGGKFMRRTGKIGGGRFTVIMGVDALEAFTNSAKFKEKNDLINYSTDAIAPAQLNAEGGNYHGHIQAGGQKFDLWTYDEVYEHPDTGVLTPYINPNYVIIIPPKPRFILAYAAVPQLFKGVATPAMTEGKFLLGEHFDEKATAHNMDIKSAGVAVPVQVDGIYTMKVLAD
jgi:hypothetical protein